MNTNDYIKTLEDRIGRLEKLIIWLLATSLIGLATIIGDLGYTYHSKGEQISTSDYTLVKKH